jgi:outer membrane lipoprotein-sorting protein
MSAPRRLRQVVPAVALCVVGALGLLAGNPATAQSTISPNINDYVASKLDDFSAVMRVRQHDDNAGRKIHKDFGLIYKLKGDVQVRYKEASKLRLDAHVGASNATLINNGSIQYVRFAGLRDRRDLGKEPGKRKTLLDVGMISASYLEYTEAQFLGARPVDGVMCAVFNITYRDKNDSSHRVVWIDPKTRITVKREEYSQKGKLNATFYYKDPQEVVPDIWFPTRIEAWNNEGQKAGETGYQNIKVNQGLPETLFQL